MKKFITLFLLAFMIFGMFSIAMAQDGDDSIAVAPDAQSPETVFKSYAKAVYDGNLNEVKKYCYSKSIFFLYDGRKMLDIEKNVLPKDIQNLSREEKKEYQYKFLVLKCEGKSPKNPALTVHGEAWLIVENKYWKVYNYKQI